MISQTVVIKNASGLHARPAVNFVSTAKQFKSNVRVHSGTRAVNGKSIVAVLSAGITANSEIRLEIDGEDEAAAISRTLAKLTKNDFIKVTFYDKTRYRKECGAVTEINFTVGYFYVGIVKVFIDDISEITIVG